MTPPVELVLRSVEVSDASAKFVEVAFVSVLLVAKKIDEVALVVLLFVAKKFVEVALVVVPKFTERRSIDEDALMVIPRVEVGVRAPEVICQSLNAVGV